MSNLLKLLIIGGDSFLGKNFILYQNDSFDIDAVSRVRTGYKKEIVCEDLFGLREENFKDIDIVIHCAAIVHQRKKLQHSLYMKVNAELPVFIASLAKKAGVKTFVQISTIAVYGKVEHINISTEESPVNAYGFSKLSADNNLMKMHDTSFRVIIVRPPMIYGGGAAPGNMMRLIEIIAKGFPLPFKKLTNLRDFIHIGNLTNIIQLLILSDYYGVMLVSDGNPVNSTELNNIITRELAIKNRAFRLPKFILNILKKIIPGIFEKLFGTLTIDISTLTRTLPYKPIYTLDEGLQEMCIAFKKNKH
jgi:UDP-glucose 4-epimerase